MKETKFQADLVAKLKAGGAYTFNVHGHAMQASGWPDLQVYSPVWTGHLELKVGRNKAAPLQNARIRELRRRGVFAFVLWETGVLQDHEGKGHGVLDLEQTGFEILQQLKRLS